MTVTGAARKQAGLYYDKGAAVFNVMHPDFGAKGDGKAITDAAITNGAAILTSATAGFTAADVGKTMAVSNAGTPTALTGTVSATAGAATFSVSQAGQLTNGNVIIVAGVPYTISAFSGTTTATLSGSPTFGATAFGFATTLITTILTYTNSTTVVLAANASATLTSGAVKYGSDDSAAIQSALTAAAGLVPVVVPRTSGFFFATTGITLASNTYLQIDGTLQMGTRLDALFTGTSQSNIHVSGKGKVKGTGTHYPSLVSRIFYFTGCSDVSVVGPEISNSVWGAHFETCTDFDFNCRVRDISDTTDGTQGYGVIVTLDSARFRIGGRFYQIGRHPIYINSGSHGGVVDDVVVDGTYGAGISIFSTSAQNPTKDITLGSVVLRNIGQGSGASTYGINLTVNTESIAITSGVVMDTVDQDAIHIEGGATEITTNNPRDITIDCPLLKNVGAGIKVLNSNNISIAKPVIRNCTGTAISITTTGTGTGSFVDKVLLQSYDIVNAATGITFNDDGTGTRLTNCSLGWGQLKTISGSKFNIPSTNGGNVRYTGPGITLGSLRISSAL